MKVRSGFVSNSSTSSFICEICGENVTGMDISYDDADMFMCHNGHVMCTEHALKDLDSVEKDDDYYDYGVPEEFCPICQYQEISYSDARRYLVKTSGIDEDTVFQEIKQVNKRSTA